MEYRYLKYKFEKQVDIEALDCPFVLRVERVVGVVHAMDLDPMCDAHNVYWVDTNRRIITITPIWGYCLGVKTKQEKYELSKECVNELLTMLKEDDHLLLWYTRDVIQNMRG